MPTKCGIENCEKGYHLPLTNHLHKRAAHGPHSLTCSEEGCEMGRISESFRGFNEHMLQAHRFISHPDKYDFGTGCSVPHCTGQQSEKSRLTHTTWLKRHLAKAHGITTDCRESALTLDVDEIDLGSYPQTSTKAAVLLANYCWTNGTPTVSLETLWRSRSAELVEPGQLEIGTHLSSVGPHFHTLSCGQLIL
jgi:hypothetical protein